MEKVWKRLIAVSLSLMLMFTMGLNVFAAENVDGTPDPAVTLDESDAVVTDVESADEAMAQEEDSEVTEPKVTAKGGEIGAKSTEELDNVLAAIDTLSNDPSDFTADDADRVEAIQAAYEALSAEDQAAVDNKPGSEHPTNDGQSYGRILESAVWAVRSFTTDTSTALAPGTYTTMTDPAVSSESSKGKSDSSRVRNWWVESVEVSGDGQATAYIYVTKGAATASKLTSYPSVWTGGQTIDRDDNNNYAIPVDLNGTTYFGGISSSMSRPIMYSLSTTIEEPKAAIDLDITNNNGMFKAVTAYLTSEGGQEYLVMALSGKSYHELFKGTYEQAVANGNGTADIGNNSWIHGATNSDGLWEFKIPLDADETYVPIVAISDSYYQNSLTGQNSLARAFYPRQLTLDRDAKTLVTGDYEYTQELAVENNINMFKDPAAVINTVGGPNSNNYKSELVLTMQNDSYNKMFVGTYQQAGEAETTIDLTEDKTFTVPVRWVESFGQPETMKTLIGDPFKVSFASKKNGNWYEREITINEENGTIVFNDVLADYTLVDEAIANVPEDLTIYTDETAKAVTDAVAAATKRNKNIAEQETVNGMATAINNAVNALIAKTDISDAMAVDAIPAHTYKGIALTPDVTVKLGDETLEKDKDYTVAYSNNTNAGEATVTIQGMGNYSGKTTAYFVINKANNTLAVSGKTVKIKKKKVRKKAQKLAAGAVLTVSNAQGTVTYKGVGVNKKSKKALKINASTGQVTVKKKTKKGTYKMNVTVTAAGNNNYNPASATRTITVKVK